MKEIFHNWTVERSIMPIKPWRRWGLPAPKSEASSGKLSLIDYEVYSGIEVHDWPFFVRLDGWAFHNLTQKLGLKKPFDRKLAAALAKCAESLFIPFNPILCYIFSDEASFLFTAPTSFRRIEKIDSVFAGLFSSRFGMLMNTVAAFDCRVIPVGKRNVIRYLEWRQAECSRNHNNAWAHWTMLKKAGLGSGAANERLRGLKACDLFDLCKSYGVDLGSSPVWQRHGVFLYMQKYKKYGRNPLTGKRVLVDRRRVKIDWSPPTFASSAGHAFLSSVLSG